MKVSVMIAAKNEVGMIEDAIRSVQSFTDDIVVVDDYSTDKTADIAKYMGAKVFKRKLDGFASQKNYGIEKTRNQWVLVLDADERVSEALAEEIQKITPKKTMAAYSIAFRNHIGTKWLRHGGLYPDYHLRLLNKRLARYGQREIHEELEVRGEVATIQGDITHYTYANLGEYLHKVKKYSDLERKTLAQPVRVRVVVKEFLVRYFKLSGWKDGYYGLMSALYLTYYKWRLARRAIS